LDKYFWTSENFTEELITIRTTDYLNRTIYWLHNSKPKTLDDHFKQEEYVAAKRQKGFSKNKLEDFQEIESFYHLHKRTQDYDIIFNFFYGDNASQSLGYKMHGVKNITAYDYASIITK